MHKWPAGLTPAFEIVQFCTCRRCSCLRRTFDLTQTPPEFDIATAAVDHLDATDDDMLAILESAQQVDVRDLGPESDAGLLECDAEPDEDEHSGDCFRPSTGEFCSRFFSECD
jgi:hypothetical protein